MKIEEFISTKWGLEKVNMVKSLQENGGRIVFLVDTIKGYYIAKLYNAELLQEEIESYTNTLIFLENTHVRVPLVVRLLDGSLYAKFNNRYMYLMEYIPGSVLTDNLSDGFDLGVALANLHKINGYTKNSGIACKKRISDMLQRFKNYDFKPEYDKIVESLPDFDALKQCFIHTDICPKNAMRNLDGDVVLIDFDDAGIGSLFIDVGYPLITQFVKYENKIDGMIPPNPDAIYFDFDGAKAFYDGYFTVTSLTSDQKQLIFEGALFMQFMYMPIFGEEAIPFLWKQLKFAVDNKRDILGIFDLY